MTDLAVLDRAHHTIMKWFIETGQAPHYVELARALGLGVEEGRQVLHDLMASGVPAWVQSQPLLVDHGGSETVLRDRVVGAEH